MDNHNLIDPMDFNIQRPEFVPVDDWNPEPQDCLFKTDRDMIYLNVSKFFGAVDNPQFNTFIISSKYKRSYNSPIIREHCCLYLNYFEKFYDMDHELYAIYARLKFLIDCVPAYSQEAFFHDLMRYIASGSVFIKLGYMNEANYRLNLSYPYKIDPALGYKDIHGKVLMKISLTMCSMIPLLCHFMFKKQISNSSIFLLTIYDQIIDVFDVDIYNKLYETSTSTVGKNVSNNQGIWNMQDIRGTNATMHSIECIQNILINIMPKYIYSDNPVKLDFASIRKSTDFQVIDIAYEYNFISLSSSKRDDDLNSEFDKFESFLTKEDEALYLQNEVSEEYAMRKIEMSYGPFDPDEIKHYRLALSDGAKSPINAFQMGLVFNLFYKEFQDPNPTNSINLDDYVKLIIAAKKMLLANNLVILPYIISSKVVRLSIRKSVSKSELAKLECNPLYQQVMDKYKSEKVKKHIFGLLGTALSSEFRLIDYKGKYDGKKLNIVPELIREEILMYTLLI